MGTCHICRRKSPLISSKLGVCGPCIKSRPEQAIEVSRRAHEFGRKRLGLPSQVPKEAGSPTCTHCPNHCKIREGGLGFCGIFTNRSGRIQSVLGEGVGLVSYYRDPHPTNCVAAWCCAGGSKAGYPTYSVSNGPEMGYSNAAVFVGSCTFHCLFCQNHFTWASMIASRSPTMLDSHLASSILSDPRYTCLCWFGGCPSSQMEFVVSVSRRIAEERRGRVLRVCLETNGNIEAGYLREISELSLESGGGMKFDLKFFSPQLQQAVCGTGHGQVLENFRQLGALNAQRRDPPFLRASTLMVPGYVDPEEISDLAGFIASVDPSIPYSLLAFSPCYLMSDLPVCTTRYVDKCKRAAISAGLERVRVGNRWLVS